jgi:hypothetical protein
MAERRTADDAEPRGQVIAIHEKPERLVCTEVLEL